MGRPFLLPLFKPDAETRFQQDQSAIWRIHRDIARDFAFPTVAIGKELFLVIVEFFAGFGREFEIRTVRRVPSLRRGPASMVMACAGQIASQSLQAMQRSSPFG